MVIHGTYRFGKKLVACRNTYCTTCKAPVFAEGFRSILVLHIFFIPILPFGTDVRWYCTRCKREADAGRPSRPFILVAGILCGLLLVFIGVMIALQANDPTGYWVSLFGSLMTAGLAFLIRKQDYGTFLSSSKAVTPLAGDFCPYCREPLFAKVTPRCHTCRINIMTR
jgi:hypothetical protein